VIYFELLISALKVHGYNFGDMSLDVIEANQRVNLATISHESQDIL